MLTIHGKFIQVGLPDDGEMPKINGFMFIKNGCFIGGSKIGSKKEALAMLDLAARKGLKPMQVLGYAKCLPILICWICFQDRGNSYEGRP